MDKMGLFSRTLRGIGGFAAFLWLSACSTHLAASAYRRQEGHAFPPDASTQLGQAIAPLMQAHPGESGFMLLPTGKEAFLMRIAMIETAERSVDLQYYSIENDQTGKMLLEALIKAADRGVRVRVLVDDLNLNGADKTLLVLNGHPHIEIRVFNPFTTKGESLFARMEDSISGAGGFARRMHNKAFLVDNYVAVLGGRNLGDQYFGYGEDYNFRDLDVFAAGPLVPEVSASFDRYWNSDESYPIEALRPPTLSAEKLSDLRAELDSFWEEQKREGELQRLIPLAEQLKKESIPLLWGKAELAVDAPEKIERPQEASHSAPAARILQLAEQTHAQLIIISPYFIPGERGTQWIEALRKRGVTVKILTNSLASSDVIAVHAHYRKYRLSLLRAGALLHELKPVGRKKRRPIALHTKTYISDHRDVMIGSFNFDQRSLHLNTELLVCIHSPELAAQAEAWFAKITDSEHSYAVKLGKTGADSLEWTSTEKDAPEQFTHEPETSLWRRTKSNLLSLFPIEDQL